MPALELFVPGRLAVMGEHSDWAGELRRFNEDIQPGQCLVCGTNEGLFARASPAPHDPEDPDDEAAAGVLEMTSTAPDGKKATCSMLLQREELIERARKGDFWSYVAGTAYVMLDRFHVRGISIDNYKTTLPASKGLSSSAAVCVMVARAFNLIFSLGLSARGEMEIAYAGEVLTPSKCGRMDQCVAFGHRPVLMTFDGDLLATKVLDIPHGVEFYWLLIDLAGTKSTSRILEGLQDGYPQLHGDEDTRAIQSGVRELLGPINTRIVQAAVAALESGDPAAMGQLMLEAQREFDAKAMPACPSELTSPKLHALLDLQEVTEQFGAKGVGSQGDGTAQVLCRSEADREQVKAAIARDFPEMDCMNLTLRHAMDSAAAAGATVNPIAQAEALEVGIGSAAAFTAAERLVQDLVTEGHGHDTHDGPDGVRDILVQHGAAGVAATEAGEEQVTVAAVALLASRYRRAESRRRRALVLGPFSACCGGKPA
jgi:galactokinase